MSDHTLESAITDAQNTDVAFAALADERRRRVLRRLRSSTKPVALADLARDVAGSESDGDVRPETIDQVYATLHHTHLPKLDDAGYVRLDEERATVSPTDDADALAASLAWAAECSDG